MSNLQKNAEGVFSEYLEKYFDESECLNLLSEQIKDKEDLISRKNFRGHITASGLVLFQNKILLIFHNKLQKYIQPGGHCDEEDFSILDVAKREVLEETGLRTEIYGKKFSEPLYIDSHKIPENEKKGEQEHFHHDFLFLLKPLTEKVLLDKTEVSDYRWVDLDYDFKDREIKNAVKKLLELI